MASQAIEMSLRNSGEQSGIHILRIKGMINSDTAPIFERELEKILKQGINRVLVNLAEVEYVSSAGVGVFVGMLQHFRDHQNGDLKACSVALKIMKVFEAIGLNDVMDFLESEADLSKWTTQVPASVVEPMHHFQLAIPANGIYSGEAFLLRVEARDVSRKIVESYQGRVQLKVSVGMPFPRELTGFKAGVVEGQVAITASGEVALTVTDGKYEGSMMITIQERPNKLQFPQTFKCKSCEAEIVVKAPDIYRCEECDETFTVDDWGHVFTIKAGSTAKRRKSRYKGLELKINADVNYLGIIRTIISGLCEKEGMDEVTTNAVALAIDEILLNLIEHGNDYDPWQILRLRMEFQKKQVKIQIRDYGDPYDVTQHKDVSIKTGVMKGSKRGVGGFMVNQLMDQVKYESTATFNELTMIKHYGGREKEKPVS